MADFGVQLFGNAGNPQVNNTGSVTAAFLAKGSKTLNQRQSSSTAPSYNNIWRASSDPFVTVPGARFYAFRARYNDRPVGVWDEIGGETRSVEFVASGLNDGTLPIVDWWAFGRPAGNPETYGAWAKNDDGLMSWSSAGRPMKIEAFINDGNLARVDAGRAGDWAVCVGRPFGAVQSGSETSVSGAWRWLEARAMWGAPDSTGFGQPSRIAALQKDGNSYPTGWRLQDMKATILLVDVSGL